VLTALAALLAGLVTAIGILALLTGGVLATLRAALNVVIFGPRREAVPLVQGSSVSCTPCGPKSRLRRRRPAEPGEGPLEACGRPGGHLAAAVYAFGKGLELNGERPQTVGFFDCGWMQRLGAPGDPRSRPGTVAPNTSLRPMPGAYEVRLHHPTSH
jgi:hypothetical protein